MRAITQMFQRIAVAFNNPDNGTTAERPPAQLTVGQFYFDTTLGQPVWWDGLVWVDSGTLTPPGGAANSVQYNNAGAFGGLTLSDGQVLIGDTGGAPIPATLTAGTNVTITNGPGSILIDVSGSTPPGGAPNDIQFNNAGAFGGVTLDDGELLIGDTGGVPIAATLTGTANRLSVTGAAGSITLNIDAAYVGQATITTLGTVTTGVWNGTVVGEAFGGTGESTYTNGQLLIGNTGTSGLDKATLTAGDGITITNAGGSITIAAAIVPPQGRLTLTSGTPVMTADVTGATTIYYAAYVGENVPVGATTPVNLPIAAGQISMGLDAGVPRVASGSIYDIFAVNNGGALALCVGPAWTSTTARGTGAGTTELELANGIWTNKNSITNAWGGAAGTTDLGPIAANAGTYLGSFYATANGQTAMQFEPARAAGGTNNFLGLYNAYNRVRTYARSQDSGASWTYATTTWRAANNSASMRVTWLDGLQQSRVFATYSIVSQTPAGNNSGIGVNFDSTAATPGGITGYNTGSTEQSLTSRDSAILLGLHYAQGMETRLGGAGTITYRNQVFAGPWTGGVTLELDM